MSNFRETISQTLHSNLADERERERPIDRLRAFSKAPRLSTLLWRLKYDLDSSALQEAIEALQKASGGNESLCEMAIQEWLGESCKVCKGAREMIAGEKRIVCTSCHGDGLHRYTDTARANYLKTSLNQARRYAKQIQHIHVVLAKYDRLGNATINWELERLKVV